MLDPIVIRHVTGSVYSLHFPTQASLCGTMLRFQEFYESPKFRGTVFTRQEFEEWYIQRTGKFTYLTDWSGFNFPSHVLKGFRDGTMGELSPMEKQVVDLVAYIPEPFYLIAIATDDSDSVGTLRHEIAHGLYATNADYRAEVLMHLEGARLAPIHRLLYTAYHPSVWLDECHAYVGMSYDYLQEKGALKPGELLETHLALTSVFEFYVQNHSRLIHEFD